MATLHLDNLERGFPGGIRAVADLTLDVQDGESIAVLGPSGSGKTTLLRLIAGLEKPTSGKVILDSVDITGFPPHLRDIAIVFQNASLYPHLTVSENLWFATRLLHIGRNEARLRLTQAAQMCNLGHLMDRPTGGLSGGELQRAAIARAVVRRPKCLLLDEPFSAVDAGMRRGLRSELRALHRQLGLTMIYVTHDQDDAFALGDRIAVMQQGRLLQCDLPSELLARPTTPFVAGFVGTPPRSMLRGQIHRQGQIVWFKRRDGEWPAPQLSSLADPMPRSEIEAWIPASAVRLLSGRDAEETEQLQCIVAGYERLGGQAVLQLVTADGELIAAHASVDERPQTGVTASAILDLSEAVFFQAGQLLTAKEQSCA